MAKKKKGKGCLIIVALLIVFAIVGSLGGGDDKEPANTGKEVKQQEEKVEAVKISAKDLVAAYEANEVKANEDYKKKELEITGVVASIGETMGEKYITLSAENDATLSTVQALFKEDNAKELGSLNKGQQVTIIGTCDGLLMNVLIKDSKLISK